jgi:hypothetical protein
VHAPVQNVGRVATEDTAIPLARPFVDKSGALQHEIRVRKGDLITLPIGAVHRDEGMWDADAREWKCVCGARAARDENADGRDAQAGALARRSARGEQDRPGHLEPPAHVPRRLARVHRLSVLAARVRSVASSPASVVTLMGM